MKISINILILVACSILLTACAPKKGYNSTAWNYSVEVINKSSNTIEYLTIRLPGYDRAITARGNLAVGKRDTSHAVNVPLRGVATANWLIDGRKYFQTIDLNQFNLKSYKRGCLVVTVKDNDGIDFSFR